MPEESSSEAPDADQVRHGPSIDILRGMTEVDVAHIMLNPANDFWTNKVNRPPLSTVCILNEATVNAHEPPWHRCFPRSSCSGINTVGID